MQKISYHYIGLLCLIIYLIAGMYQVSQTIGMIITVFKKSDTIDLTQSYYSCKYISIQLFLRLRKKIHKQWKESTFSMTILNLVLVMGILLPTQCCNTVLLFKRFLLTIQGYCEYMQIIIKHLIQNCFKETLLE